MTDVDKIVECYEFALKIVPKNIKSDNMKVECADPLAVVCLAELLYKWKYCKEKPQPIKFK